MVYLFVCLLAGLYKKTTQSIFYTKFGGKVAHGPRRIPLDLGGNPDLELDPETFDGIVTILYCYYALFNE